jgi:RimJ/RimL family protein N-acetyltransferase
MHPRKRRPVVAPVIETERLVLRGHRAADLPAYAAMWGDPEVVRYIGGRPFTPEETWSRLLRGVGHWAVTGFGYWIVEEKASGRLAGETGLADFKREMTPSLGGAPEAGWVMAPWAHGRGYATEAVRAALAWGDEHLKPERTVCIIAPENTASIRVAKKCGFEEVSRTTYKGDAIVIFER